LKIWIILCIIYKRPGSNLDNTSLAERILVAIWQKEQVNLADLKRVLNLNHNRLKPSIDLLVKFGFVEFNEADGLLKLSPSIRIFLDEIQKLEAEPDQE
jgi:DNA-binding MarR family transcriptional regulator